MEMIKKQVIEAVEELLEVANLKKGDVFVLGASSSEVRGEHIGKGSSEKIGREIISGLLAVLEPRGIYLAVQGCEHINRALTIEREAQEAYGFEIVSVKPSLHAGGSCSVSAMDLFKDPVVVEHIVAQAGIDIGDTFIGMHVKHVQVPVRLRVDKVGEAHLTALRSRPKLIGGERATY